MKKTTFNPVSTYRLQFHKGFKFRDAAEIIPFLDKLGVQTVYASPIMKASKGSNHGYDVCDPTTINPEIGTEKEFRQLIATLKERKMNWIQDIVPNHMAFSPENPWIYDLLQKGAASEYHSYFDIQSSGKAGVSDKLMLPFFGSSTEDLIEKKELKLAFSSKGFVLKYYANAYPLSLESYTFILEGLLPGELPELFRKQSEKIVPLNDSEKMIRNLWQKSRSSENLKVAIQERIDNINKDSNLIKRLLSLQHYQPVHWKITEKKINFRRFFTINGLISLNIQDEAVFQSVHRKIASLISEGLIDGLRIDHIDGLFDPGKYLRSLSELVGKETYIIVEKILEEDEKLPPDWPVQGSTGYDFLAMVNNLLTNEESSATLKAYNNDWDREQEDYGSLTLRKKRFFLYNRLAGDLENLTTLLMDLPGHIRPEGSEAILKETIAEFIVHCPVYRVYNEPGSFSDENRAILSEVIRSARKGNKKLIKPLDELLDMFFLKKVKKHEEKAQVAQFFRRCMQYTGPLMAKGIEDTIFYSYNPFIAHNEVGDSPGYFGIRIDEFHTYMKDRHREFPLAMNTTSTHDTKRGEDARARLNILSDIPEEWISATRNWKAMNASAKQVHNDISVPTENDEYFIYQSLCAHIPETGLVDDSFRERFNSFLIKALREAKLNTSWSDPDEDYEEITLKFTEKILRENGEFLQSLNAFLEILIPRGITNSLTQLALKLTVPGLPDIYQGNEYWNFDMVDPDNRKPVPFKELADSLDKLIETGSNSDQAKTYSGWINDSNPLIKLSLTHQLLALRKDDPELFSKGEYMPLSVKGKYKKHIIAFCRKYRDRYFIAILPLNVKVEKNFSWGSTRVLIPEMYPRKWTSLIGGESSEFDHELPLKVIMPDLPFSFLKGKPENSRRLAGVLMHISSLPGKFGTGDLGSGSREFIDILEKGKQSYWQLLPLSITTAKTSFSPYSSYSAFAGNIMYIDPEDLVELGLIKQEMFRSHQIKSREKAKFGTALQIKEKMISEAYSAFREGSGGADLQKSFEEFKKDEKIWLDDFALFSCIRKDNKGKPWHEWPNDLAMHDAAALKAYSIHREDYLEEIKFGQFIFSLQWNNVKEYANDRGVDIIGDVPIYMDHNSADVWANRHLFKLDEKGKMLSVAGVPPDYFNEKGQLWGMPVFDWKAHKTEKYRWWLMRLKKNLEWFDLLRLDHFRGFIAYWEVPADENSAINGKWVRGPGKDLFRAIQKEFPDMPFIAEDLGDIDEDVYILRDEFELPGMKVLQFGFGRKMAQQEHNPLNINYNSIAYTGTHDNNTSRGWFATETDKKTRKRLKKFSGRNIKEQNVHKEFIRMAYSSPAKIAIVPLQDWLGLDEKSRMNFPSTTSGNWKWRIKRKVLSEKLAGRMNKYVRTFGRY